MAADCKSATHRVTEVRILLSAPIPGRFGDDCPVLPSTAGIAQLVERQPSKLNVAGSNPVSRSILPRPPDHSGEAARFKAHIAQW